jgi:hypothetical protein
MSIMSGIGELHALGLSFPEPTAQAGSMPVPAPVRRSPDRNRLLAHAAAFMSGAGHAVTLVLALAPAAAGAALTLGAMGLIKL